MCYNFLSFTALIQTIIPPGNLHTAIKCFQTFEAANHTYWHNVYVPFVAELVLSCFTSAVPGRQYFECKSNNQLGSVTCSFDGGPETECSLPVVVTIDRFGTDPHTVAITVTDGFGQSQSVSFSFKLLERKNK